MDQKDFIKKFSAGLFFLLGIALMFVIVFMIGKGRGFAQPKFQVAVLYRDVGGLIEGAPVQLAGVNVGAVDTIDFLIVEHQGRRVKVVLNIFEKYKYQLQKPIRVLINTEGILGEKIVVIEVGKGGRRVDLSRPVIGEDPLNVQDLAQVFAEAAESFTATSEDLNKVDVHELSEVLAETARSLSATSEGLNTILTEMHYISLKSKRLLDRLEQKVIDGNLFKVF